MRDEGPAAVVAAAAAAAAEAATVAAAKEAATSSQLKTLEEKVEQQDLQIKTLEGALKGAQHALESVLAPVSSLQSPTVPKKATGKDDDGSGILHIIPGDLWGLRDLLLIGYSGVFMQRNSSGLSLVRKGALELANLLPTIHPFQPCRTEVASVLAESQSESERNLILKVAASLWSCLPEKFDFNHFTPSRNLHTTSPFSEEMIDDYMKAFKGRMPQLKNAAWLRACSKSSWIRACSYWIAIHLMAERADASKKSGEFLQALVPVLAGGANLCSGCTLHFMTMFKDHINKSIITDRVNGF
jgi:hypothetical protein